MTNSLDKFPPAPTQDQSLRQAVVHHKAGRLQDAERLYRAILQAQPQHPDANHNLGVLAVQVKKPAAGLPYFKAALEANPNQGQYWLSYIDALIQTGQMDVARKVLAQGRQRGLQGNAVDALVGRLEGPSSDEIKTLADLFNQGRYTEGEALSKALTECFPQDGFAWKVLGAMLMLQGRSAEALEHLQKAAELLPGDAEAHNNLGVTLKELGRLTESEVSYRRALEIKPDSAEALNNLGVILKELGHCKAAFDIAAGTAEEGKEIATAEANAAVAGLEKDWKNLKSKRPKTRSSLIRPVPRRMSVSLSPSSISGMQFSRNWPPTLICSTESSGILGRNILWQIAKLWLRFTTFYGAVRRMDFFEVHDRPGCIFLKVLRRAFLEDRISQW